MKLKLPVLLLTLLFSSGAFSTEIRFLNYQFDPLVKVPSADPVPIETAQGEGLFLVQFNGKIKHDWLDQLAAQDFELLQYYPDNTYLVWGNSSQIRATENFSFVRWAGSFNKAYRKSPHLKGRMGMISNVDVHFYNSGSPEALVNKLSSLGANVLNYYPAQPDKKLYDAIIQVEQNNLDMLTAIPEVVWIGYVGAEPILDDESSSQTVAGNFEGTGQPSLNYDNWLTTIGLDGSGVIWSITDTGVDYTHGDLNTRIVGGHNYPGCEFASPGDDPASGGHGTHVAGITGGDATAGFTDGDGYLYGLGVAPGYSIFAQNPICGSQNSWPPAGGWQELSKQGVLGGALGANNSWTSGEGTNHGYQATERTIDIATRDGNFDVPGAEEYIWVFSAGNSGPGSNTLTSPKEAKNVIVTAATQTWRVSGDVEAMASFSSRGPAVDGRTVPTIAAPGQSVGSTRNDDGGSCGTAIAGTNNQYSFCSGTSMAAPQTSGAVVLIAEWWRNNNAGADPSAAMSKALLVNTAHDISGAGDIPNNAEGWGQINLKNLFEPVTPFEFFDQEEILDDTGDVWEITVGVQDTNEPLKVTLTWSDAPGAIGANPALVNNLDLEVVNGGNTYLGNDFSGGVSTTGGSADVINNNENVFIPAPGGSATIRVRAVNIAGDGVPFIGDATDQDFALVCSNCALQEDYTLSTTPSEVSVCSPVDADYLVDVGSILSYSDPVTLSTNNLPANALASYTSNPVIPGNTTTLTISNTANVAVGQHLFELEANSTSGMKTNDLELNVFDAIPSSANLTAPADTSTNVDVMPTLTWDAVTQAGSYVVEIDDDSDFSSIVYSATVDTNSHDVDQELNTSTTYYWRVRTINACGPSTSAVYSFTTEVAPGDCALGTNQVNYYYFDFQDDDLIYAHGYEDGPGLTAGDPTDEGFTISTAAGDVNWELLGVGSGGTTAFQADDLPSVNDTTLVTPMLTMPTGVGPLTLRFWNTQTIEDGGAGCYDAVQLMVSTDGSTFTQISDADIINNAYDGTIDSGFSNPAAGEQGWCGDPMAETVFNVDVDNYAGQTVQFGFRMASDSSVGRPEGWVIDDVRITGCEAP